MICLTCRQYGFTIRGKCATCAPCLHAEYHPAMKAVEIAGDAFFRKTGKRALQDWGAFETFLEQGRAFEAGNTNVNL